MDPIRSIVVPTDFSPLSEGAVARAASVAGPDGAAIHLLHAVRFPLIASPYEVSVPAAVWEGVRKAAEEQIEALRKATEERTGGIVTATVSDSSDPVEAIADAVEGHDADLVVMGTHGHGGIKHAFLGSVAERTLRTIDRPILVVKEDAARAAEPITRILLAVDFSPHSDRAVEVAADFAERFDAAVDVIHAFDLPRDYIPFASDFGVELIEKLRENASEQLEAIRTRLEQREIPLNLQSRRGSPSVVIAECAEEFGSQLIVMGTRGTSGLAHVLLGSTAERTIRTAPCSVLAVKAPESGA